MGGRSEIQTPVSRYHLKHLLSSRIGMSLNTGHITGADLWAFLPMLKYVSLIGLIVSRENV